MNSDNKSKNLLRVLQVTKFYPPQFDNIGNSVMETVDSLKNFCDLTVLTCQTRNKSRSDVINDVIVNRSGTLFTVKNQPFSTEFIRDLKDFSTRNGIIHLHMPFPLGEFAYLLSNSTARLVITWHYESQSGLTLFYNFLIEKILKKAEAIFVNNQKMVENSEILSKFKKKCHIIPLSVNVDNYDYDEYLPILTKNLTHSYNKKILYVGNFIYSVNINLILSAFKFIKGGELFIYVKNSLQLDIINLEMEEKYDDKIHFLSKFNTEDVNFALADCDFLVYPALDNTDTGFEILEAFAFGKPVISSEIDKISDININHKTGLTVPQNDVAALASAIQYLINSDEILRIMGINAYKRVRKNFDSNLTAKSIIDIYARISAGNFTQN